jgi:peptide/nickel transport system permease protein
LSIAGLATPSFWLAVLLILVFSSYLHLLPASGPLPSPSTDFGGYMARMIMPAVSLAVPLTGQMTRIVRTAMVEELDKDYVRTAKGSGLPKGVIIARNVLRNALITPVTTLGMKIGYLMGGAVVIEVIFNLPGMGMAILDGVSGNEPMLVMGVVIVVALSFIVINIVVDMLYLLINPRIRSV